MPNIESREQSKLQYQITFGGVIDSIFENFEEANIEFEKISNEHPDEDIELWKAERLK